MITLALKTEAGDISSAKDSKAQPWFEIPKVSNHTLGAVPRRDKVNCKRNKTIICYFLI